MNIKRTVAVLAALGAFAAAGCGSDDESGSSGSSSSGSTSTGASSGAPKANVSGDPITVGFICTCTAPTTQGALGPSEDVIQAWASYTNANGGINGHPVKVISEDDAGDPAKSLQAAKKLVETDKVMAIVGQQSLQDAAWEKYVTDKGIPVVGGIALEPTYLTSPSFYPSGSTLPLMLYGIVEQAKKAGKTKLGLFYCAESPVCATLGPILEGLGALEGVEVTAQKVSSTAPNYTAPCLALKQDGVDSLFIGMSSTLVPTIIDACAKQGYTPLNIASGGTTSGVWTENPNLVGTTISATNAVYTDDSIPAVKEFLTALDDYVPGLTDDPQFSYPLINPWAGGQLFKAAGEAAKLTPDSTPEDVKKGLYALKDETLGGLAPPLNFTEGKPAFPACYFAAEITEDGYAPLDGNADPTCPDPETVGKIGAALGG
jgi:branched-chain amino acid transport system substrate-binding protein